MSSFPFQFGAGANYSFVGFDRVPQPPGFVESLQNELAGLKSIASQQLVAAEAANKASAKALVEAQLEATMARRCFDSLRADYHTLRFEHEALDEEAQSLRANSQRAMEEYDQLAALTTKNDDYVRQINKHSSEIKKLQEDHNTTKHNLEAQEKAVAFKEKELSYLREANEQLKKDLRHEKEATAHHESVVKDLYADLEQSRNTRKAASKARDDALVQQKDLELQFEELRKQWEEDQGKLAELEERLEDFQRLDDEHAGLQEDLDTLREQLTDNERTLMVKDERIAHLETQYQKERQRNLNAAHADDLAARTTSPVEEPPQPLNTLVDSLEEELALASEYDDSVHSSDRSFREPNEHSDIYEIANYAPAMPAPAPASTIDIYEAASVTPIATTTPKHAVSVSEAASVAPSEAVLPQLNMYIETANSVSPVDATVPPLTLNFVTPVHVPPIQAVVPELTLNVDTAASVFPIAAVMPQLSFDVETAGSVTPVEPTVPRLTMDLDTVASVSPKKASVPRLHLRVGTAASVMHVEAKSPRLRLDVNTATSVAPIEAAAQKLTTRIETASSVTPTEPQRTSADSFAQTEALELSTEIPSHATSVTTPIAPTAPNLTTRIVDTAIIAIQPLEAPQIVENLTSHILDDATLTVTPVDIPDMEHRLTASMLDDATIDIAPCDPLNDSSNLSSSMIDTATIAIEPIEVAREPTLRQELTSHMISSATIAINPVEIPRIEKTSGTNGVTKQLSNRNVLPPKDTSVLVWTVYLLSAAWVALSAYCWSLKQELNSWEKANGIGIYASHGQMYDRILFNMFPVALDSGLLAHTIRAFEEWFGISYPLLY